MKRLLLLLALAVVVTAIPARADAAVPCRNKIYNDWYHDGKIASTYPISCYRDALTHVKGDLKVYSSLTDDIHSALQAAIARKAGAKNVPAQVGKGNPGAKPVLVDGTTTTKSNRSQTPVSQTVTNASAPTGSSGGIPTPLLVLGGLAILLAAAGAIGMYARRGRGGDPV